jgi:hypothetical protein
MKLGNIPCDITVFLKLDPKHEQRLCGTPWKEKKHFNNIPVRNKRFSISHFHPVQ